MLQEVYLKLFLHHNSHHRIHSNSNSKCNHSNSIQIMWISISESKSFLNNNKVSLIPTQLISLTQQINRTILTPSITLLLKYHSNNSHSSHNNNSNNNQLQISSTKVSDSQATSIHSKLPRINNNILIMDIQISVHLLTLIYLLFNNNSTISPQFKYQLSTSHQSNLNNNQLKDSSNNSSSSLHSNHKSKYPLTTMNNL